MTATPTRFADMVGVDHRLATVLERQGMPTAFPVQAAVVPMAITGKDVLVKSPTGSGKTLAFGIPIVERLPRNATTPHALILVPTRELAVQVCEDLAPVATGKQLKVLAVYGGAPMYKQAQAARTAAIVVATPGRLDDLIRNRKIDLRDVKILVLDEADRMLDMGFQPQVDAIVDTLRGQRQTMLFSATLEGPVAKIARSYTDDAQVITTDIAPGAGGEINHVMWMTTGGTKIDTVVEALELERDLAVVFVRTKRGADTLVERLRGFGLRANSIHGGMSQNERLREYRRFQQGTCDVLVATDVFARGMDLDRITLVINYDLPEDADTYQHRTGRTGRAGRAGTAVTMFTSSQRKAVRRMIREAGLEMSVFDDIRQTKRTRRQPLPVEQHFTPAAPKAASGGKKPFERGPRHGERAQGGGAPQRGEWRGGPKSSPARGNQRFNPGNGRSNAHRTAAKIAGGPGDGSVLSFDASKGFGFIKPDSGGADIFFHKKSLAKGGDTESLERGTRVAFGTQQHERGVRAEGVRVLATNRS